MRPACGFADPRRAVPFGLVEGGKAGIGIGLQDSTEVGEMLAGMLSLAIRREGVGAGRWRRTAPRPVIAQVDPDPTLLDALADAFDAPDGSRTRTGVSSACRRSACHDALPDPLNQRLQHPNAWPHQSTRSRRERPRPSGRGSHAAGKGADDRRTCRRGSRPAAPARPWTAGSDAKARRAG